MQLNWNLDNLYGNKSQYDKEKVYLMSLKENVNEELLYRYEKIIVSSYLYALKGLEKIETYNYLYQKYCYIYAKINNFDYNEYDEDSFLDYKRLYNIIFENGVVIHKHINYINHNSMYMDYYAEFTNKYLIPNCDNIIKLINFSVYNNSSYDKLIDLIDRKIKLSDWINKSLQTRQSFLGKKNLKLIDIGIELNNFGDFELGFLKKGIKEINTAIIRDEFIEKMFNEGWIDINSKNENITIVSNFFHPFIMSNFNGNLISSMQLTHEIGHVINQYLEIKTDLYQEILPIVEEIMLCKYIEMHNQAKERINNLVIDRCIIDMIFYLIKIKMKRNCSDSYLLSKKLNDVWIYYLKNYFDENILYSEEDNYQWMLIDFSSTIEIDLSYLLGNYFSLMIYNEKLSFDELVYHLKNGYVEKILLDVN